MRDSIVNPIRQGIRRSIRGSGGSPVPALRLPLTSDLVPALALNPVTASFVRATDATYIDDSGILQTVGANVSRHTFKGVLIEGASTNELTEAADLSQWANTGSVDVQGYAVGLDGANSAQRIIDDGSAIAGGVYVARSVTLSTTTQYTSYAILKKDQLDWALITMVGLSGASAFAYFDLNNGEIGASKGAANEKETIKHLGNGWYLCSITFTTAADGAGSIRIYATDSNGNVTVDRDGTSSILYFGSQIEAGAFPTSYIPTGASSAQRNAPTGPSYPASGNASFPLTMSIKVTPNQIGRQGWLMDIADGANNRASLFFSASGKAQVSVYSGGVLQAVLTGTTTLAVGTQYTISAVVAANDVRLYVNGVSEGTPDTTVTVPTAPTNIYIGQRYSGSDQPFAWLSDGLVYLKALTASEIPS